MAVLVILFYPNAWANSYQTGLQFYQQKRWLQAKFNFQKFLKKNPKHGRTLFFLGYSHYQLKEYKKARFFFQYLYKQYPKNKSVLFYLGLVDLKEKKYALAIKDFHSLPKSKKFEGWKAFNTAIAYQKLKRCKKALLFYNLAYQENQKFFSKYQWYFRNSASCYLQLGRFKDVNRIVLQGLNLFPKQFWFYELAAQNALYQRDRKQYWKYSEQAFTILQQQVEWKSLPTISFPLRGKWKVVQGNHGNRTHLGITNRFAWDFVFLGKKQTTSFGQPIFSPISGVVVFVQDGYDDQDKNKQIPQKKQTGNWIRIQYSKNLYLEVKHLKKNSIRVHVGQKVSRHDKIGEVGNSGFSFGSHLHIQATTQIQHGFLSRPLQFQNYFRWEGNKKTLILRGIPKEGEVISSK